MPQRKIKLTTALPAPSQALNPPKKSYCMFCGNQLPQWSEAVNCSAKACREQQEDLRKKRKSLEWDGVIEPGYIFQCTQACIF